MGDPRDDDEAQGDQEDKSVVEIPKEGERDPSKPDEEEDQPAKPEQEPPVPLPDLAKATELEILDTEEPPPLDQAPAIIPPAPGLAVAYLAGLAIGAAGLAVFILLPNLSQTFTDPMTRLAATLGVVVVAMSGVLVWFASSRAHASEVVHAAIQHRARLEQQLAWYTSAHSKARSELERFVYVASHDLVEPMRQATSYVQMLQRRYADKLDEKGQEYVQFAAEGVIRIKEIVDTMLAFRRSGETDAPKERTDLTDVLREAITRHRERLDDAGGEVDYDPLPTVLVDPGQMVQVFDALISNSIKFRSQNRPQIKITSRRTDDEYIISVRDNGIGVEPAYHKRIFVMFQRLNDRAEYPGMGMGLSVAQRIIDHHGGKMWADSPSYGPGLVVYFSLPRRGAGPQAAGDGLAGKIAQKAAREAASGNR